ncbi:transmembrane protein 272-like [Morone saxatilis]|uniref:transmembrane protein 272-like n=1 Tax=Morone saxatilis TaxID=34816 RepID=UPI0015E24267|nr:transmembrane protein 272-like [Morone saxatilis]
MAESDRPQITWQRSTVIVACTVVFFFTMLFVQLVVGVVYMNDCPRQPIIPIYLFLMGCSPLLFRCLNKITPLFCFMAPGLFLVWFIVGTLNIYSIYEPNYNKNTTKVNPYCDKTLYLFAFWTTNFTFALLPALLFSWFYCFYQFDIVEVQMPLLG